MPESDRMAEPEKEMSSDNSSRSRQWHLPELLLAAGFVVGLAALWFIRPQRELLSLVLFINLAALAIYDARSFRLPNLLTLSLFIAGVAAIIIAPRYPVVDHLIGAAVGLFLFPAINFVYRQIRGHDGIGMGDAKLLAGLGLWLGWPALPPLVLIGSLLGLAYAGLVVVLKRDEKSKHAVKNPIPFGLFLAIAGWFVWLFF